MLWFRNEINISPTVRLWSRIQVAEVRIAVYLKFASHSCIFNACSFSGLSSFLRGDCATRDTSMVPGELALEASLAIKSICKEEGKLQTGVIHSYYKRM